MNTMDKGQARGLAAASILALSVTVGAGTAHAADIYRSGSGIGVHTDAAVTCTSNGYRLLAATPLMGTTAGWAFGQNVAWKFTIVDATTGMTVWADPGWRTARINTAWYSYDYYGHRTLQTSTYGSLPDMTWTMAPGRYRVNTTYAWQTGTAWSYATARTDVYRISQNLVGIRYANTCEIGLR